MSSKNQIVPNANVAKKNSSSQLSILGIGLIAAAILALVAIGALAGPLPALIFLIFVLVIFGFMYMYLKQYLLVDNNPQQTPENININIDNNIGPFDADCNHFNCNSDNFDQWKKYQNLVHKPNGILRSHLDDRDSYNKRNFEGSVIESVSEKNKKNDCIDALTSAKKIKASKRVRFDLPESCSDGNYGDREWDAGYKPADSEQAYGAPILNREQALSQLGQNVLTNIISTETVPELLPNGCSVSKQNAADSAINNINPSLELLPCNLKTAWAAAFVSLPSAFIPNPDPNENNPNQIDPNLAHSNSESRDIDTVRSCYRNNKTNDDDVSNLDDCQSVDQKWAAHPGGFSNCELYKKDPRAWITNLNDAIYDRSRKTAEEIDPTKFHNARQLFMQFLYSDMPNRKAKYEKPIEFLEESSYVQSKIQSA